LTIHLDELEDVVGGPFKEDQKGEFQSLFVFSCIHFEADLTSSCFAVSVGKLILANLFSGEPISTRSFHFFPSLTWTCFLFFP